ncbi:MAG: hypothetical protein DI598_11170 [Pseudopedobacter saltans]|uniref:Uncharacterized protein n=1 Tax=Pseudopedobacter saltans TaxID=151895 RepID=A0A2W5EXM1_9SPHI|nr:MAG: hypothetical protein DI598_11170 [Pseudopedobacter saltans]
MLEKITWPQYWTAIGSVSTLYYLTISSIIFKERLLHRFASKTDSSFSGSHGNLMGAIVENETEEDSLDSEDPDTDHSSNVRTLDKTETVANLITEALSSLGTNTNPTKVVSQLSGVIHQNNLDGSLSPFREAIDWHIVQTALDSCGVTLEDSDLDNIWSASV